MAQKIRPFLARLECRNDKNRSFVEFEGARIALRFILRGPNVIRVPLQFLNPVRWSISNIVNEPCLLVPIFKDEKTSRAEFRWVIGDLRGLHSQTTHGLGNFAFQVRSFCRSPGRMPRNPTLDAACKAHDPREKSRQAKRERADPRADMLGIQGAGLERSHGNSHHQAQWQI